jgi:hypothetical protein
MASAIRKGFLGVLALAGVAFTLAAPSAANADGVGDYIIESSKAATVDSCVEPTEQMRRYHFEMIKHQRDTTVYGGIRGTKHSLSTCINCHAGHDEAGQPIPVNAHGQFCAACHEYASVTVNCFDCHATVPKGESWNQVQAEQHARAMAASGARIAATTAPGRAGDERVGGESE